MTHTDASQHRDNAGTGAPVAFPPGSHAPGAPQPRISRWAVHRRLYDWMLSFSYSRYATLALFLFSFTEAIFFPIPPVVLQAPLTLERRGRAWWYALVTTAASVLGGLVGYGAGFLFSDWMRRLFSEGALHHFEEYSGNIWLLTAGAIAVHPFKLFTIAAGLFRVPLLTFVLAAAIGRGVLFFGVAALLWLFGPPIKRFIDRYFNLLTVLLGLLIVGLVVMTQVL